MYWFLPKNTILTEEGRLMGMWHCLHAICTITNLWAYSSPSMLYSIVQRTLYLVHVVDHVRWLNVATYSDDGLDGSIKWVLRITSHFHAQPFLWLWMYKHHHGFLYVQNVGHNKMKIVSLSLGYDWPFGDVRLEL